MTSDDFGIRVLAAAVATGGHGLYLVYKFVRHGRVNDISIGLLVFMVVLTTIGTIVYLRLKRSEEAASWAVARDGDDRSITKGDS